MDYEKKYNEALERAKQIRNGNPSSGTAIVVCEQIFPELRESEDERIRKWLIKTIHLIGVDKDICADQETMDKAIAWLEKQKEQKPTPDWMPKFLDELRSKKNYFDWDEHRDIEGHILAIINYIAPNYFKEKEQKPVEWSEEDENALKYIHELISWGYAEKFMDAQTAHDMRKWVNEHLGRDTFQNGNSRWSEEDTHKTERLLYLIASNKGFNREHRDEAINIIKSLRPSWKPSEEQVRALGDYIDGEEISEYDMEEIVRLYNELKKLCQ